MTDPKDYIDHLAYVGLRVMQAKVHAFMMRADQEVPDKPTVPSTAVRELRATLIKEELAELIDAQDRSDLVDVADAIADLLYVVVGTASAWGILLAPIFEEVHRSNMAKLGTGGYRREDGKWMKPPDWKEPEIAAEIRRQLD